jgi:hypothetical protein
MTATQPIDESTLNAGLGANWRIQFSDADGIPLNMLSFEVIDFGAISYKEIFQNVKTILATPLFSAALERLLGVDQTIVDLPADKSGAGAATIAILTALNQWEPRCEIVNIDFDADALNGHLIVKLQLKIKNVISGSDTPYAAKDIGTTPTNITQNLPPIEPLPGPTGPKGDTGAEGRRGSLWFVGTSAPPAGALVPMKVPTQGAKGETGEQGKRGFVWLTGAGDPVTPLDHDMYLNTTNGDVWQFDAATNTWRRTRTK